MEPTLKTGSVDSRGLVKIISIENSCVVVGFGKDFNARMEVSFSECETLFETPSVVA